MALLRASILFSAEEKPSTNSTQDSKGPIKPDNSKTNPNSEKTQKKDKKNKEEDEDEDEDDDEDDDK